MHKLNNKGFMLVETLIVAVFLVTIFSILYNNFYPLIGEYERREYFDDVDGKYSIFWIKRMIQDSYYEFTKADNDSIKNNKYIEFNCNKFGSNEIKKDMCLETLKRLENPKIYMINYVTTDFKNKVKNNEDFSLGLRDYMDYLPDYTKGSLNGAKYRIIVELHNSKDDNDFYTYATIEVKKECKGCA